MGQVTTLLNTDVQSLCFVIYGLGLLVTQSTVSAH